MRRWISLLAVLAALSSPVHLAAQDADDAAALSQQVDELLRVGRYGDALPIAQRALAILLSLAVVVSEIAASAAHAPAPLRGA